MRILIVDNYDSFTYNLTQILGILGHKFLVKKNDEFSLKEIEDYKPQKILISPGPGRPEHSKGSLIIIEKFHTFIPIFGVCLGMQAIGYFFGAKIVRSKNIIHGKTSRIQNDGKTIFRDLPSEFNVTRYHSLVIDSESLPNTLEISAFSDDGDIMAIRHKYYPIEGVQFHPEAILTEYGLEMIKNWISM